MLDGELALGLGKEEKEVVRGLRGILGLIFWEVGHFSKKKREKKRKGKVRKKRRRRRRSRLEV